MVDGKEGKGRDEIFLALKFQGNFHWHFLSKFHMVSR